MTRSRTALFVSAIAAILCVPMASHSHFVLVSPTPTLVLDSVGSPLVDPPCGDNGIAVPTGAVTSFAPNETIEVVLSETIFHPGHYRVAIALDDPADLPQDPVVTPGEGDICASAAIQDPPVFPVLADGALVHDTQLAGPQSIFVTLPDVSCERCTLQVIEFQRFRSALPCFHYHCAEIRIPEPGATSASLAGVFAIASLRATRRRR